MGMNMKQTTLIKTVHTFSLCLLLILSSCIRTTEVKESAPAQESSCTDAVESPVLGFAQQFEEKHHKKNHHQLL